MASPPSTRTVLLGLRVAEASSGPPLVGLSAWAWRADLDGPTSTRAVAQSSRRVRAATPGMNGTLAFHSLPHFGAWVGSDPALDPFVPSISIDHTVLVVDPGGRIFPVRLVRSVPRRDLLGWTWGAGDVRPTVRGWRRPDQPCHDGYAVIRATLWDPERDCPASWALLDVTTGDQVSTGLAGEDGQVAVLLPRSAPRSGMAPADQRWPLTARARYGRLVDMRNADVGTLPYTNLRADLPTADAIEAQPSASLWQSWTSPTLRTPFVAPDLIGTERILASADPLGRLYLTP